MYTWDKRKIGRNLKLMRVKKDISQMELSKALGIAQGHYSNIDSGKRQLSLHLLAKICEMFGVNPSDIIADTDDEGDAVSFEPEAAAEKSRISAMLTRTGSEVGQGQKQVACVYRQAAWMPCASPICRQADEILFLVDCVSKKARRPPPLAPAGWKTSCTRRQVSAQVRH